MRELIPFIKSLYFHNFLNVFNQISMINYTILHFGLEEYSQKQNRTSNHFMFTPKDYTWLGVDVWLNLGRAQIHAL